MKAARLQIHPCKRQCWPNKFCFCWCSVKIWWNKCNSLEPVLVSKPLPTFFIRQGGIWKARKDVSFSRGWLLFRTETSTAASNSGPVHRLLHLLFPRCQLPWYSHPYITILHVCHFIFKISISLFPFQVKISIISNSVQCFLLEWLFHFVST